MNLFGLFVNNAPNRVFFSILVGALAGISYAFLVPLVLGSLNEPAGLVEQNQEMMKFLFWEVADHRYALAFVSVCCFILLARTFSQVVLTRLALDLTTDLRTDIYKHIASAKIVNLETLGSSKLIAVLTADVPRIVIGARLFPDLIISLVSLLGMLMYLLYLEQEIFVFVVTCIFFGSVAFQLPSYFGDRYLAKSRRHLDDLHEAIRGLIYGIKELKLNQKKRDAFFDDVLAVHEAQVRDTEKTGQTIIRGALNFGDLISFFVIAAVAFVFVNYNAIGSQDLVGVIMVLLYITGPVAILLNFIPSFLAANVSVRKIDQLLREIPAEDSRPAGDDIPDWQQVHFKNITYRYQSKDGEPGFGIGPIDLTLSKGQISFIVGGNGSGKSTLSKLITLHYLAEEGEIYFDDHAVTPDSVNTLRQDIGAIYSDYHLFDRVLGNQDPKLQMQVEGYLKTFGLDQKVSFENKCFSTLALSDGQKRRLALLVAFIEDKSLYLFDEWAADQDPVFKDVFYNHMLSSLKARGKAVVVISHDDRYFHVADQLIEIENGNIKAITSEPQRNTIQAPKFQSAG